VSNPILLEMSNDIHQNARLQRFSRERRKTPIQNDEMDLAGGPKTLLPGGVVTLAGPHLEVFLESGDFN
jgi:hypothetical protein